MSSGDQIATDLRGLAAAVKAKRHRVVVQWGAALQRQAMLNASGRPGPNAPTGDYRRSISRQTTRTDDVSTVIVGTNKPQGPRLEFGFFGEDSLGRTFAQPAYPHFGPALTFVSPGFVHAVHRIADPNDRGSL